MNLDEIIKTLENVGVPPVALEHYAKHSNPIVRAMVAEHPGTPRDTLLDLACDPSHYVRCAVGRNWFHKTFDNNRLAKPRR